MELNTRNRVAGGRPVAGCCAGDQAGAETVPPHHPPSHRSYNRHGDQSGTNRNGAALLEPAGHPNSVRDVTVSLACHHSSHPAF